MKVTFLFEIKIFYKAIPKHKKKNPVSERTESTDYSLHAKDTNAII